MAVGWVSHSPALSLDHTAARQCWNARQMARVLQPRMMISHTPLRVTYPRQGHDLNPRTAAERSRDWRVLEVTRRAEAQENGLWPATALSVRGR